MNQQSIEVGVIISPLSDPLEIRSLRAKEACGQRIKHWLHIVIRIQPLASMVIAMEAQTKRDGEFVLREPCPVTTSFLNPSCYANFPVLESFLSLST